MWVVVCGEEVLALLLPPLEGAGSRWTKRTGRRTPSSLADRRLPLFRPHRAARRRTPPFRHSVKLSAPSIWGVSRRSRAASDRHRAMAELTVEGPRSNAT
uniref:Uncharacterized protein n=1 Tax=Oryza meridionalis TaxID=40149 RepID=A0A0E0EV81_9ORYZ